ncbi:MAG: hypothetical protein CL693_21545 [Cellvibrionaceae bacterium]|nr:hypothetical protein [Cellvibrionaceae bacterium]|tara:strand:+ start:26593 stop:27990 length:1398 start_codon:yes stop_codon:yes gene_type:complete
MIRVLQLNDLLGPLNAVLSGENTSFTRVNTDTRTITEGDLFVALRGERFDAHDFVAGAASAGAAAVVVEQAQAGVSIPQLEVEDTTIALGQIAQLNRRAFSRPVIALTGSCGKTTVKEMLATVLRQSGNVHVTQGNLNNHIGVPQTLLALDGSADFAVVEMGASAMGEIDYLASIAEPDVALVNNVMPAHLEGFGSEQGVADEKSNIYRQLRTNGTAILNADEPHSTAWRQELTQDRGDLTLVTFSSASTNADIYASEVRLGDAGGYHFNLCAKDQSIAVKLSLLGRQNVSNALAAAACAHAVNVPLAVIAEGLTHAQPFKGRLVSVLGINNSRVIDDSYNANPGSVLAAADVLIDMKNQNREVMLVIGDLGELGANAESVLSTLGEDLARLGVPALCTQGDNSHHISDAYMKSAAGSAKHFSSQSDLNQYLLTILTHNTVVLVKGSRSARMENVVQAITLGGEQ